jgi:hypothetical protein
VLADAHDYLPTATTANMYARPAKIPTTHDVKTSLMSGTYSCGGAASDRLTRPARVLDWRVVAAWDKVTGLPDERASRRRQPMRP